MFQDSGAIVLAGGKSSRMGQDKALLPFNGMTLLEHVVASLTGMFPHIVVVADVADKYPISCGRVIGDIYPECGPLGGILTGLTHLGAGAHLVVACDMPYLHPSVIQLLFKAVTLEWDAIVPETGGHLEPLCAVYRHTAANRLMGFLEGGNYSVHEALKTLRTKRIGEGVLRRIDPELRCFTNWNTLEDMYCSAR